jgi:hypothetical protein
MNKSTFFSGQPVLAQLIKLIPDSLIGQLVMRHGADRYYKTFKSRDHLIAMLYACFHNCTSLREVITGLEASYNKFGHLKLASMPRRSTLADANAGREVKFFEDLYQELYRLYYRSLPDSRKVKSLESRLFIMDSSTVTLFSDIMKGVGTCKTDGRKRGGVKAHVVLNAKDDVPQLIYLSEGSRNDRVFMQHVQLSKGDILVFDRGYRNYTQWQQWTDQGINWVTRLIGDEVYTVLDRKVITAQEKQKGVRSDQKIYMGRPSNKPTLKIAVRLVRFYVAGEKKMYYFLTNNFRFKASTIAALYKSRWQVETFFKRFKQTNPVKYFLGDNENAIRIQLWCAFIKDLLIKVVKDQVKRKWSFSNISSMIRHHLMNYIDVFAFLNNPDKMKNVLLSTEKQHQLPLFPT